MTLERDGTEVTSGKCGEYCKKKKALALALRGSKCYCGDAYPPKSDVVSDSKCNFPCPGYLWEACGSLDDDIYSIFNTGIELDVPEYEEEEEETSTSATPSSTQPVDKTDPADSTATTTDPSSSDGDKGDKKDGPNVAAIAAGVVVGVIVFGAGIGGLFFFMRRKRNAEIEEEHRRNAAVNAFINGSKPPGSSGSISMTDSRLDPVMAHRRLSDGSIADNQDYSRRILRVSAPTIHIVSAIT